MYPAHVGKTLPEHIGMYTPRQVAQINGATLGLQTEFGYSFDLATNTLTLVDPLLEMKNK